MYKIKIPKLSDYHLSEEIIFQYKEKIKKSEKIVKTIHIYIYIIISLFLWFFIFSRFSSRY